MGKIGVTASTVVTVEPWEGRRVMGALSANAAALLPFPITTLEVGMVYERNKHLLDRRMGQVRGAGLVYDHIGEVIASPEYFSIRKPTKSSVEFEVVKWIAASGVWVTVWLKVLKSDQAKSGQDEIWVSSGVAFPRDNQVDKDIRNGRLVPVPVATSPQTSPQADGGE